MRRKMKKLIIFLTLIVCYCSFIFANPDYKNENGTVLSTVTENDTTTTIRKCNLTLTTGTNLEVYKCKVYENPNEEKLLGTINPGDTIKISQVCEIQKPDNSWWDDYIREEIWYKISDKDLNGWIRVGTTIFISTPYNTPNPYNNDNWSILESFKHKWKKYTVRKFNQNLYVNDNVWLRKNPWKEENNTILLINGKDQPQKILVKKMVEQTEIIDDIKDHWIYVSYGENEGWIFGGYTTGSNKETEKQYNFPETIIRNSFAAQEESVPDKINSPKDTTKIKNILKVTGKIMIYILIGLVVLYFIYDKLIKKLLTKKKENSDTGNEVAEQDKKERKETEKKIHSAKIFQEKENLKTYDRINNILSYMNEGLYGKEEAIRLTLLSAIAGETIFFMGPPGTAKSMIARRMQEAFRDDTNYFEYLMSQFSTPDEICGPISLKKLGHDKYIRLTNGYLPRANIAFLDEIWKSGPAILNTLLTIINEKIYHNGNKVEKVPLIALVAASNEFPEKNKGLEALWDRFTIRVMVNPLADDKAFFDMVTRTGKVHKPSLKYKNYQLTKNEVWDFQEKITKIEVPEYIQDVIKSIRIELDNKNKETKRSDDEKYYISDRKWKKIVNILKASAFLNGRTAVDLMDCQLISYCIWGTAQQRLECKVLIEEVIKGDNVNVSSSLKALKNQISNFEKDIASIDSSGASSYIIHNAKENITNKQYLPLETEIHAEIKKIEQMQETQQTAFEQNLFVDDSFKTIVLQKLDAQKEELEVLKVKLDKIHHNYASN